MNAASVSGSTKGHTDHTIGMNKLAGQSNRSWQRLLLIICGGVLVVLWKEKSNMDSLTSFFSSDVANKIGVSSLRGEGPKRREAEEVSATNASAPIAAKQEQQDGTANITVEITEEEWKTVLASRKSNAKQHIGPVTPAPALAQPASAQPNTAQPVSAGPVSASPLSAPPVSSPPVTQPPITASPATSPPITSPPVSSAPITSPPVTSPPTTAATKTSATAQCDSQCQQQGITPDLQAFQGDDLMQSSILLKRLQQGRQEWIDKVLKRDYGPHYYQDLFEPVDDKDKQRKSVGRQGIFEDPAKLLQADSEDSAQPPEETLARRRMIRKYQMKLLQLQLNIANERLHMRHQCTEQCRTQRRRLDSNVQKKKGTYANFKWITGGHSSSAGHGNLFRESYTIVFDTAMKPILSHIGVDFEARSYGMGGSGSAEENALCLNSVFGREVDTVLWDFGQNDGQQYWAMAMYAYRVALMSKITDSRSQPGNIQYRPAMFALHPKTGNVKVMNEMQQLGLTTLVMNNKYFQKSVIATVPDMMGMSDEQIANIPTHVQYFKCDGKVESGDPGCADHKFNQTTCQERRYMVGWHPGWKIHALLGNLLTMTNLDLWEDAIRGLEELEPKAPASNNAEPETLLERKARLEEQLQKLDQEERQNYDHIFDSPVPEGLQTHLDKFLGNGDIKEHLEDIDVEAFLKSPSFCHAAFLPADIRFRGLLTENTDLTNGHYMDQSSFEQGFLEEEVNNIERPSPRLNKAPVPVNNTQPGRENQMIILQNGKDRYSGPTCVEPTLFDYKDHFYVSSLQGERTLTIPNVPSKKHYTEFDATKSRGYVVACHGRCDFSKCPKEDFHEWFGRIPPKKPKTTAEQRQAMGNLEMTVNGERVTEVSEIVHCFALKNKEGHIWKPNQNGQYVIGARITNSTTYSTMRFSSFIVL